MACHCLFSIMTALESFSLTRCSTRGASVCHRTVSVGVYFIDSFIVPGVVERRYTEQGRVSSLSEKDSGSSTNPTRISLNVAHKGYWNV
jgi:hypothetical protein